MNRYNVDYSVLGTGRVEPLLRDIRNAMYAAGPAGRVGQGRVQLRPARDRVPLRRGGQDRRRPLAVQDGRQGDRGGARAVAHVHEQVRRARGQLLPHPHEPAGARRVRGFDQAPAAGASAPSVRRVRRRRARHPARVHAALRAERQLLQALRRRQLRADRVAWGEDNRTCSVRVVGHGPSLRPELRLPGGDVNPYIALGGDARRAGCTASRPGSSCRARSRATPTPPTCRPCPTTLREARDLFAGQRRGPGGLRRRGRRPLRQRGRRRAGRVRGAPSPTGSAGEDSSACDQHEVARPGDRAGRRHRRAARRRGHRRGDRPGVRRAARLARGQPGRPGPAAAPLRRRRRRPRGGAGAARGPRRRAHDRQRPLGGGERPRRPALLRRRRRSGCSAGRSRWPAAST